MTGHRLQIVCYDKLEVEAIFESLEEASKARDKYLALKYYRNKPMGGSIIQRADLPKYWNIPVGVKING